jgi:hypothetical protein
MISSLKSLFFLIKKKKKKSLTTRQCGHTFSWYGRLMVPSAALHSMGSRM